MMSKLQVPFGSDMKRPYESGTGWCFWRWTQVKWDDVVYLTRLHLLKALWAWIMLHWIHEPDPHPDPHDHPSWFISITLRGRYTEVVYEPGAKTSGRYKCQRIRFNRATHVHRIISAEPGTLTLVIGGAWKSRVWGFHTKDGFVNWRTYTENHK